MSVRPTLVHVTHEAAGKIGGIGAVLEGLCTCNAYLKAVGRTIMVSPLFRKEGTLCERLGPEGEVLYSFIDGYTNTSYAGSFEEIEKAFNVGIVYGRRTFIDKMTGISSSPEVILVDITEIKPEPVNKLKKEMFEEFGIQSNLYEHIWEYEQYVRLAPPAIAVIKALGVGKDGDKTVVVAHEFMGIPTALAAILDEGGEFTTVFDAHEVATVRRFVEDHPGHDTMFYNVMEAARRKKLCFNDVFGDQNDFFKHVLVDASKHCDNILAVGDYVGEELRFLGPEFESANIDIVYNGIPAHEISLEEKQASRERLQSYCKNLLGYKPDYIFTHVTRLIRSKGLWRDLLVLEHIEKVLERQNKTGVLFVLSTEVSQRGRKDILRMEAEYRWPVAHREGMPDLSGGEANYYTGVQEFNARSRNIRVVFINQFGFSMETCGNRMPREMELMDIRKGSDVEFGQSVYEPFGISQLEPLSFGGICVISKICGCVGLVRNVTGGSDVRNVIIADYTAMDGRKVSNLEELLKIDERARQQVEYQVSKKVASEILKRLPQHTDEAEQMITSGYELARHMSWEAVVGNRLVKSIEKAIKHRSYSHDVGLRA